MNYFTPTPQPEYKNLDLPAFMLKYERFNKKKPVFTRAYIFRLLRWAELEYTDTKKHLEAKNSSLALSKLNSLTPRNAQAMIIANTPIFAELITAMNDGLWNSLPVHIQKFLAEAYKIYKG